MNKLLVFGGAVAAIALLFAKMQGATLGSTAYTLLAPFDAMRKRNRQTEKV